MSIVPSGGGPASDQAISQAVAMKVRRTCKNEPSEPCSLRWSKLSCVEGKRSIRMRELGVQIGNNR